MADLKTKLTNMKVAELRSELGKLGLEKQGTKLVLVDRLLKHYETAAKDGSPVTENGIKNEPEDKSTGEETVVVDEVLDLDSANDEQGVEDEEEEEQTEQHESNDSQNEELMDETEEAYVGDETEEQEVLGEDEEMEGEGDGEGEGEWENGEDAETQVIGDTVDDEDNEGDALNISVEESEVLGIEQDSKAGDEDQEEADDPAKNEGETSADQQDSSNNTSATGKNEEESDNKTGEGETENAEETPTCKDSERHIILVTGLSSDTSANDLKTFFRKYGKIGRIKIMTNTRVPGSQRFAHISVPSLDELKYLVETLNGVQLKGKSIRVAKAPEDGSVSRSYEIAVATAKAEADGGDTSNKEDNGKSSESHEAAASGSTQNGKGIDESEDAQNLKDKGKDANKKDSENGKKADADKKKEDKKESPADKKTPEKNSRPDRAAGHRSRKESHDRPRGEHLRQNNRNFRRDKDSTEWKRHGPPRGPMEVTRVHRDRPPMGRAPPPNSGGRRRSPHAAQLTFEQIREIRDEQRRREHERRKREEERERAAEVERQKRLEYQNYMEFKQLEKEREKLRLERERIEREKQELIRLERERQKAEREKIEREKEELRRAKMNIEHPRSSGPVKRPYEDEKVNRRRESNERKKPFVVERGRPDGKTEAERKMERERYARERMHVGHSSEGRSRSPFRASGGSSATVTRESRRDVWARDERDRPGRVRTRSDERSHRRETEAEKVAAAERRSREAPSRAAGSSSDLLSRHPFESTHSSSRGADLTKRPSDRYDDGRVSTSRDGEWIQRSYLAPTSSLPLPMSTSASAGRDSWPFTESRKIEAWDTSRLAPRTEQWISGAGATVGATGRSSLPVVPPPPPLYSAAASLALQGSGLGLGGYASADRYDGYRGGFHPLRKY